MIKILMVCTGNICRSPYAERFLQVQLDKISPKTFTVRSAGTHAMNGQNMDERAAAKLSEVGGTSTGFKARQLTLETVSDANLLLAMTEDQCSRIVELSPSLLKKTYTVREFATVIQEVTSDNNVIIPYGKDPQISFNRWSALIKHSPIKRYSARTIQAGNMDVIDPYRRPDVFFDTMVDELLPAMLTLIEFERHYSDLQFRF